MGRMGWKLTTQSEGACALPALRRAATEGGSLALDFGLVVGTASPRLLVVAHVSAIVWTAKMLGLAGSLHTRKASRFVIFVAVAALACAVYLGIEAAAWAGLYLCLGALPYWQNGMLDIAQRNHQLRSRSMSS